MKKFLKSCAKKSLSLFMAVMMLLSCWVWVAPERAEAANQDEGKYYVEVRGWLDDYEETSNITTNQWSIKHANGSNILTSGDVYNGGANDTTGNFVHAYGWVDAFPTGIKHVFATGCEDWAWGVRNVVVYVKNFDDNSWVAISEANGGYTAQSNTYEDSQITKFLSDDKLTPAPKSFRNSDGVIETAEFDIPELGGTATPKATFKTAGVYDQYGVKLTDREVTYKVGDQAMSLEYTKETDGVWVEGTTVYANADVQKNLPNTGNTQKVYLIAQSGTDQGIIAEISLNYPKYVVKVDPGFSDAVVDMSDGNTQTGIWQNEGVYDTAAAKWPKGTATKTGYTFKGFWTKQQPTSGDARYNASDAAFATPVSTTDFVNVYGGTENGEYVEKDGKKYYNAGRQWDPSTDKKISGPDNFYGWWISSDIPVKFYDIDGSYLGTQTAKYGNKPGTDWYPNPKESYNAGAFTYETFAGQWRDMETGEIITEGTYTFGPHDSLILTPIYQKSEYKNTHKVTFIDPANGNAIQDSSKEYDYRYILGGSEIPSVAVPAFLTQNSGYSYEFAGWTTQKPASGNYHAINVNDTSVSINNDWVVREDVTYYAVFKGTVKEYLVSFTYTDTTGTSQTIVKTVPYGSAISTPADVNRIYATGGYGYNLLGWGYKNATNANATLDVDGTVVFNDSNIFFTTGNLAPDGTAIKFTAKYDEGQPTPYTVTFKYKDEKGISKNLIKEVYHGYYITDEIVNELDVPAQYDDGNALYTFSGMWQVTEGTAAKGEYATDDLTSVSPVSHITFEAVYDDGVPFYTVTYVDGAKTYSERVLAGSTVPAWTVTEKDEEEGDITTEYVPVKAETETGEYIFEGWFDEEQADADFAQTNGTKYTLEDTVDRDLVLYPQFKFSPFTFTIKFMNFDGTVQLAAAEVEAGQSFEFAFVEAQRAAQYREADDVYTYKFIGWDKKIPDNYRCEGVDVTYTALYQPSYRYYQAYWYADNSFADDKLLTTTNHTWNSAVYAPSVEITAPEGKTFAGWYYLKDGVETAFLRGMKIVPGMKFYATYEDATVTYTVKAIVNGEETKYYVNAGSKLPVPADPASGFVNDTYHNEFDGWFTAATGGEEFDFDTAINADTTIYAQFTVAEHTKDQKELVSVPTYYAKGSEKVWCACSKENTLTTVEIPMLTDTKAPTGVIYLGTQGSWSSTDAVGAAATDNDPVTLYANADTDIILTINDTGDVNNAYNPSGVGKGIAKIQGIISTGVFGAGTTEIAGIKTIFEDSSENLNNTANYVIRLGEYEGLVDGATYIAYYYAVDKAGNTLNKNVRTAKFIYDATAPQFTVAGDNNAATAGLSIVTYCGVATVQDIEDGATVTVNGAAVTVAEGKYVINEAGNYLITVTDKAGNSTTKKIIVADGHNKVTTSKDVTCSEDGYLKETCAVCSKVLKNETIESAGHQYGPESTVAPTCEGKGYTIATCSVCGYENITKEVAAAGHKHAKDADGNLIYEVVTKATCSTEGKKISNCTVCGKDTKTATIAKDTTEAGHNYGAVKVLKATCTQDGEEYSNCKYCFEKKTVKVLPALNHVDTGRYTKVTTEPTCYSEGAETTYCKACDAEIGEPTTVATVAHTLKLIKYEADGYMQYECQVDGCTHTEGKKDIVTVKKYTVTFKNAAGEILYTATVNDGESIEKDTVADQVKAKDAEYEYTFAGWKGDDGKVVKLPVKVTKNQVYTPEFSATKRIYTHIFKVPTVAEDAIVVANADSNYKVFATLVGNYNDENKKPAGVPTLPADSNYTYEFKGWSADGVNIASDFTMVDDTTYVAIFKATPVKYSVAYTNNNQYFWSESVNGGATVTVTDKVATKAADSKYHYNFAGWLYNGATYTAGQTLENVAEDIMFSAKYTAVEHAYGTLVSEVAATCTKQGSKVMACSCGATTTIVTDMLSHNYVTQDDGSKKCSLCGDIKEAEVKEVSITFKHGKDIVKTVKVAEGNTYTITAADITKTAQYEYKFKNWTDAAGNVVSTEAKLTVTAGATDATYTANYEETVRTYTVSYMSWDLLTVLDTHYNVPYGAAVPAYKGTVTPTKKRDASNHYYFSKWDVAADATVSGDMAIVPVFTAEAHNYLGTYTEEATCTTPGKTYKACNAPGCDFVDVVPMVGTTLPHTPIEGTYKETAPTLGNDGSRSFTCATCKGEISEVIPAIPADKITIIVYNSKGQLAANGTAEITLYEIVDGERVLYKHPDGTEANPVNTNSNGSATFTVPQGKKWYAGVVGDEIEGGYGGEVKAGTNTFGKAAVEEEKPTEGDCSCSCHKNTFWGLIFRFFQKIIKFFSGNPKCCGNPDSRI